MRTVITTLIATALVLTGILLAPGPAWSEPPEDASKTAPAKPAKMKRTRRDVDNTAVVDLCDLAQARECVVWNQTDADLVVKSTTSDADCSAVTIDIDGAAPNDTDITRVPAGSTLTETLEQGGTLCGKMHTAPTGDCSASGTSLDCVYTVEAT